MGYEVTFHYYEEGAEKGKYNEEEKKTKSITVGKLTEEISLDVLAGKIMAQFARRNILVVDVEIYEYTKKKINFKEEQDGIRIKNKKFRFDDGASVTLEETPESNADQLASLIIANPQLLAQLQAQLGGQTTVVHPHQLIQRPNQQPQPQPQPQVRLQTGGQVPVGAHRPAMRYEIFDPIDPALINIAKQKGWQFTMGKRYPIFEEKPGMQITDGMLYSTVDDSGKPRMVSDKFFVPVQNKLSGNFIEDSMENNIVGGRSGPAPRLLWDGAVESDMPVIRR
jgi:hypothetical protein